MGLRTRRYRKERHVVVLGLALASLGCLALELVRERHYAALDFQFLLWNLFLAWVPFILALVVYDRYRRGTPLVRLLPALALWLLFLPNAPYIVTDFVHLSAARMPPLWFDGVELSAFAWTGHAARFRLALPRARGRPAPLRRDRPAGLGVFGVLALVSAGVFLGRVKRWNSWDVLTQPRSLLAQLHAHVDDPASLVRATGVTLATTAALALAYLVFYALMDARLARD